MMVLIGSLSSGPSAYSQQRQAFIRQLFAENDYFRAIGALKEERFYSQDTAVRNTCAYMIGYAYLQSGKYQNARDYFSMLTDDETHPMPRLRRYARIGTALAYWGDKLSNYSMMELNKIPSAEDSGGIARFYKAVLTAEKDVALSAVLVENLRKESISSTIAEKSEKIRQLLKKHEDIPTKSPLAAGILSAIIPGAGQVYTQHYFDGIQALTFVSAFGYATYAAYQYNKSAGNSHAGTIALGILTGIFHTSNILGAVKTADYRNQKATDDFMGAIRTQAFSIDLSVEW